MPYTEYPPPPSLKPWVKCCWSILDEPSDAIQDVWPDGCIELVFSPGNTSLVRDDGSSQPFPKAAVIGLQTRIIRVRCDGPVRLLGARLLPMSIRDWRPEALEAISEQIEPLILLHQFAAAVKLLQTWLEQQPPIGGRLTSALQKLYQAGGSATISQLAAAEGVSTRQLERVFASKLGVSPKLLAQVVRFARGWSRMLSKPDLALADLALELGYADQAHFSNEFHSFGKQSPSAFRKTLRNK